MSNFESIRWGLLGCGDIANKRVADAMLRDPRSALTAACRRDIAKLQEFGKQFDVSDLTGAAEELIEHPDLDAVYVATPVHLHCQHTIQAAEAGKHVLVEKPMAMNPLECRQMIDACSANGVKLGVAYYRRFYPSVSRIAELIGNGSLGRPLSILAVTGNENRFPADDWRVLKKYGGGGPLMDIGSHRLDLFDHLFGDISNVTAHCGASPDFEAEETATLLVEFASGASGVLQCYFGTIDVPDRLEVVGTDGRVTIESLNDDEVLIVDRSGTRTEQHPPNANLHSPLIEDFSRAVVGDREPMINGETGRKTNLAIQLAYDWALKPNLDQKFG